MTTAEENSPKWVGLFVAIFVALVVDGMDLQLLNLCLPVLKEHFAVSHIQVAALISYTLIGMGIGSIFAGVLADRIGRVKVTVISLILFSSFTALLAFTQTYWQFALVRFMSGFGIAALYAIGTLLVAEVVPDSKRSTILGTLQAGWSIGYIVAAFISAAILPSHGWRPLFVLSIIPAVLSYLILRKAKEPVSYVASKQERKSRPKENEYKQIWLNKSSRKIFILWAIANIALQFGYYGANSFIPSYLTTDLGMNLKNMSLYVAGTYTAMVFSKILSGWLADKLGRKSIWVFGGIATAIAMPCIIHYADTSNVIYLMILFGCLYAIPYAILSTYMSESFPVEIRGTSVATMSAIGKIGSITAPLFVGYMATQYSIGFGIALLGIAYVICALVPGFFIREKIYDPSVVETKSNLAA